MNKFEEIIKKTKQIRLNPEERSEIRARLSVIAGIPQTSRFSVFRFLRPIPIMAGFLIVAVTGGGVSLAAENSLPGDVLYPIKVSVNEEVRAALTISKEKKDEWSAQRAERRLEEAEKLDEEGRLDAEKIARLSEAFDRQTAKIALVEQRIELAQSKKAAEISRATEKLDAALTAHSRILAKLTDGNDNAGDALISASAAPESSFMMAAAPTRSFIKEEKLDEISIKAKRVAEKMIDNADQKDGIRMEKAKQFLKEAEDKFDNGKYGEAIVLFRQAGRAAQVKGDPIPVQAVKRVIQRLKD